MNAVSNMLEVIKNVMDENFTEDVEMYLAYMEDDLREEFDKMEQRASELRYNLTQIVSLRALEQLGKVKVEMPEWDAAILKEELDQTGNRMIEILETIRGIHKALRELGYQVDAEIIPLHIYREMRDSWEN